jgi:N-acetylmuramic acid 6-phosphate etherase
MPSAAAAASTRVPRRTGRIQPLRRFILGVEGGGTRTTAVLAAADEIETTPPLVLGPSNLRMLSDRELIWRLREIAERLPVVPGALLAVAVGLAGTRTPADRERIRHACSRVFPRVPCHATDDLETALAAAPALPGVDARVLILSGTGSCCFGVACDGRTAKVGGRGHVIGDRGSANDIGLRALRELVVEADRSGRWPMLGALILDALALNTAEDLIDWSMHADKTDIASLSIPVFAAAARRDALARRILDVTAEALATDAGACAARLASRNKPVQFVLNGGVLLKNPSFARDVGRRLQKQFPHAVITPLGVASVWGAVRLAQRVIAPTGALPASGARSLGPPPVSPVLSLEALRDSPTERRNPRSMHLDTMPLARAVDLMLEEESRVPAAIAAERAGIVRVVKAVLAAFRAGGHLFYVGAGTSGRLGVLDASECPPTFRAPREQVQGIIAGGQQALWNAVEGAEDDIDGGVQAIRHRNVASNDVVIGLAASGRTPFVWGALAEAGRRGATTALVCFNPALKKALMHGKGAFRPNVIIAADLGPEVLTGSTRLKAGTATKQILNIFTTLAMSRVGKVISNLMVDLNPSNEKLRDRAQRILHELTGASPDEARTALDAAGWNVKQAYESLRPGKRRRASNIE